jgi:hypothetical protein
LHPHNIAEPTMATCTQPVRVIHPAANTPRRAWAFVILAIGLPILSGLLWHQASDNPLWPLMRHGLAHCELRELPLSPLSPDGAYRVRVVQATSFGRFTETLVFLTPDDAPWRPGTVDPNHAILEVAGLRSLDAIDWREGAGGAPILQLWFVPGAAPREIHRIDHLWRDVTILSRTSAPASGVHGLD